MYNSNEAILYYSYMFRLHQINHLQAVYQKCSEEINFL